MSTAFAQQVAQMEAEFAAAWPQMISAIQSGDRTKVGIQTGQGILLYVNQVSYAKGASIEAVLAGQAPPTEVIVTSDGRVAWTGIWHDVETDGPMSETSVYYEKWTGPSCRPGHGYVDAESRKVVQTG